MWKRIIWKVKYIVGLVKFILLLGCMGRVKSRVCIVCPYCENFWGQRSLSHWDSYQTRGMSFQLSKITCSIRTSVLEYVEFWIPLFVTDTNWHRILHVNVSRHFGVCACDLYFPMKNFLINRNSSISCSAGVEVQYFYPCIQNTIGIMTNELNAKLTPCLGWSLSSSWNSLGNRNCFFYDHRGK